MIEKLYIGVFTGRTLMGVAASGTRIVLVLAFGEESYQECHDASAG